MPVCLIYMLRRTERSVRRGDQTENVIPPVLRLNFLSCQFPEILQRYFHSSIPIHTWTLNLCHPLAFAQLEVAFEVPRLAAPCAVYLGFGVVRHIVSPARLVFLSGLNF